MRTLSLRILVVLSLLCVPLLAHANNVTVSGNVSFASLDGSVDDADGVTNGVFTVTGDLVVNGTINCNDDSGRVSACAMSFNVGHDFTVNAGGGIYAENRTGGGTGGAITLSVGHDFAMRAPSGTLAGAIISTDSSSSSGSTGGNVTATVAGAATIESGATIDAGSSNAAAGAISVVAGGHLDVSGNVLSGPSRTILATRLTDAALGGGTANEIGGAITLRSTTYTEPGVTIGSNASIVSQGETSGAGPVTIEGCGVFVKGLVASLARKDATSRVAIRSGKWIQIDGRDLGITGATLGRNGRVRADAPTGTAINHTLDLFAVDRVEIDGPDAAASSAFVLSGVPGVHDSKSDGAAIHVIATNGTVTASGNAIDDGRAASGDDGGNIVISAKSNINLDHAVIYSYGDTNTSNAARGGGTITVRSYSGNIVWTNGSADVRPTGSSSGVAAAAQGAISLTACGTISLSGSTFPTNGAPVGTWPAQTTGACSPANPSLPAGEPSLPVCNTPPVAANSSATTNEDNAVTITMTGSDADGDSLTFSIVTNPAHGTLSAIFNATPTSAQVTYTPNANYNGPDSFTFQVDDGKGGTSIGTVTITVNPVNDPPTFNLGANPVTSLEDAGPQTLAAYASSISAGPTADEASQTVTFTVTNDNNALFSVQPAIASNGTLTYTSAPNANGSANITVVAHDNGGTANGGNDTSSTHNFNIVVTAVNDAPSFTKGADQTALEDSGAHSVAGWATAISAGPADEAGQTVTFTTSNDNAALFSVAPAVASNGTLTYTLAANANGSATVSVVAHDNGGTANGGVDTSAPQTFTISVTAVNDPPSFTSGGNVSVLEDTGAYSAAWASAISAGPADESGQTVAFTAANDNNSLFSAQPVISPGGVLTFTPAANANGTATVTVTAQDNGGTANGGNDTSAAQTFTITVTAVNDAPSFTSGGNVSSFEDNAYSAPWATAISAGPANESGQTVSFHATNDNNALFSSQPSVSSTGVLSYTPAPNANGTATVSVYAQDNGGTANGGVDSSAPQTFTITVTAVNDAPSFTSGGNVAVLEDSGSYSASWATSISAGPADESSQTVTFTATNNNNALFTVQPSVSSAGVLTFTPAADANGTATITVTLQDNGGTANGGSDTSAAQTFTITVNPVNDAPSFTSGGNVSSFEDNAYSAPWATAISAGPTNESGQTVSFHATNDNNALFSSQPSVSSTGVLSYTPAPNANGTATVSVYAQDNGGTANGGVDSSAPQTFTITVNAVNDAPSFTSGGNVAVLEDSGSYSAPWPTAISAGPADESSQTVTFHVSNDNNALFSAQPSISPSGVLTFTPAADAFGTATVTVTLQDNGGTANGGVDTSAPQTFTVTLNPVNDAPSFTPGASVTTGDNTSYSAPWATAISAGPANESGQTVAFHVTNDNNALFSVQPAISPSGVLSFATLANHTGSATVTVYLQDNGGTANGGVDTSASVTFSITITHTNVAPVANNDSYETIGNTQLEVNASHTTATSVFVSGSVLANDVDADGPSPLTATLVSSTAGAAVTVNANGTFTYTPPVGFTGTDAFTYSVSDGSASSTATVSILVKSPRVWYVKNDAPALGSGRSIDPFTQLSSAQASATAGDTIYVFTGDGTTTGQNNGIVLSQTNERLIGEGVALTVNVGVNGNPAPTQLRVAGTAPQIGNPSGDGVASNNTSGVEVQGISADGAPNAIHITTSAIGSGSATIANNIVRSATAEGIKVVSGGTGGLTVALTNNTVTATGNGIDASAIGGALRLSVDGNSNVTSLIGSGIAISGAGTTITSFNGNSVSGNTALDGITMSGGVVFDAVPGGTLNPVSGGITTIGSVGNGVGRNGIVLAGTIGDLSFGTLTIVADNGSGLLVTGGGQFTGAAGTEVESAGGSVTAVGGPAISISNATAGLTLASASSTASVGSGISLSSVNGTVNVAGGAISGPAGAGVDINAGTANVTYGGTVATTVSRPVQVQNTTGGTKSFGGAITSTNLGIFLNSNGGAAIAFSGPMTLTTGANAAFTATGGGTVTATGSGSVLATTTGVGVTVQNTTIGAAGLKFQSVSSNGASSGIVLNATGAAGGINVTGNGGAGTGGTIQGTTNAVSLTSTSNVQLAWMNLQNNTNSAILGSSVAGGTLDHVVVSGTNGTTTIAAVDFTSLTGSFNVNNSNISGGTTDNFRVLNNSGETLNRFTVSNTTFGLNSTANGNDSLVLQATNGTLNVTVQNSIFTGAAGDTFQIDMHGTAVSDLIFTGNTLTNAHPAIISGGGGVTISSGGAGDNVTFTYNFSGNAFSGASGAALGIGKGSGTGSFNGTINGNTFGISGVVNSGSKFGTDVFVSSVGGGTNTVHITNNNIYQYNSFGIGLQIGNNSSGGVGSLNATVTGNTIAQPGSGAAVMNGFNLNVGTVTNDANFACISFGGAGALANSLTGSGKNGGTDFRLRQRFATTVRLPGYAGANNDTAAVVAFVQSQNGVTPTGAAAVSVPTGGGFVGGAACP
jgi:hypothetical protein